MIKHRILKTLQFSRYFHAVFSTTWKHRGSRTKRSF